MKEGLQKQAGIWKLLPAGPQPRPRPWDNAGAPAARTRTDPPPDQRSFEIEVTPQPTSALALQPGQRVVIQFEMPPKPLLAQWWRSLRQLTQRRFQV